MKKGNLGLILSLVLFAAMSSLASTAVLAAYPEKPVTIIVGYTPGGTMDVTARAIAEATKKYFPQPIAVINRPGGGGSIGAAETIQAKPDGYTVGLSNQETLTFLPHRSKLPYQSPEDYTSIITLVINNVLIAVKSTSPWKNIQEFMAYARANPGQVRVASSGIGTTQHINLEQLKAAAKLNLQHVPFAGAAEVIPALLGGHVEAMVSHPGNTLPYYQPGKVRVLAVFEKKRNPLFPDAPTFREIGYDLIHETCYVIFGPKGIPSKDLSTLHDAFKKGMEDPIFIKPMESRGFIVFYEGPQELKNRLIRDYEINGKFAADLRKMEGK
jgi:tripartite-type tricarboxylate transporter receptor subunit TctC